MRKRLESILLALCMALALLQGTAAAFELPPDTDFWVGLTQAEAAGMIERIANKTETREVVLICYPADGFAPIPTAIKQFSDYANQNRIKLYYYAFSGGAGDPSRIDGDLEKLFEVKSDAWPDWPIAVTYNTSTKTALSREYVATLVGAPELPVNGLRDLMQENGVANGSSGADPGPEPDPDPMPDPEPGHGEAIPAPPPPALPGDMDEMGWEVLRLVNQHRMGIGLTPLSVFRELQDTASLRAQEIYVDYRPDHTRPDGRICWTAYQECEVLYHYSAENIASGQTTAASVMNSWLHSPGHRRNIESPHSVHIGVGHYYGTRPAAGKHNWTQDFAAATYCRFTGLELSAQAIYGKPGTDLESLLADANLAVTTSCYCHGTCTLPLIAAMCSGYDEQAEGDQTVTVTYGGQSTRLTIAARHTWDNGQITLAPTCTEAGVMTYSCSLPGCGTMKTEAIPAAGHSFLQDSVCGRCGTGLGDAIGEGLGTSLAPAGLSQEEAAAYAEDLAEEQLEELGVPGCSPSVQVETYTPPVGETTDTPGAYGQLDYTVIVTQPESELMLLSASRGNTSPVLRLDIPPVFLAGPDNIHENACIITFDAAGGRVQPAAMSAGIDGTLPRLPVPTRTGYSFAGWFAEPSGGSMVTADTVFSDDTTIYARWVSDSPSSGSSGSGSSKPDPGPDRESNTKTYYTVSVSASSGGRIRLSPGKAAAGDTVTVTALPDEGYLLAGISAVDRDGNPLELAEAGGGKYTFTMPRRTVTLSAEFRPAPPPEAEETVPETPWHNPFTDVSGDAWYYDAVEFASRNHLMNGYEGSRFAPDAPLSRAMLVQILYNQAGRPAAAEEGIFPDVPAGSVYAGAVSWSAANGITGGYGDGLFRPYDRITREQMVTILWRYEGSPESSGAPLTFSDSGQISAYAQEAVRWAVEKGIIGGYQTGVLAPGGQTTRAQAAQILKNYLVGPASGR